MKFAGEYGPALGMIGATVAGGCASLAMVYGLGDGSPETMEMAKKTAATLILTGTASALSGGILGTFRQGILTEEEYDEMRYGDHWEQQVEQTRHAPKGAVPVIDDPTRQEDFQAAMQMAVTAMDRMPQAKQKFIEAMQKSPEARQAMTEAVLGAHDAPEKQREIAMEIADQVSRDQADNDHDPGGPKLG